MAYLLIVEDSAQELEHIVQKRIKEGYDLHGQTYSNLVESYELNGKTFYVYQFYQALRNENP